MRLLLLVALGGALGAMARYGLSGWLTRGDWPWGTLAVNVLGSFLLGLLLFSGMLTLGMGPELRITIAVGFLGAFTTMSTFAVETVAMTSAVALGNIVANVGGSLLAVVLGRAVGVAITGVGA